MDEPEKIWVRSIKHHTYWNIPREVDTFYQVDTEQDADTLEALHMAVRDDPPPKAVRPSAPSSKPRVATDAQLPNPQVMTTADMPTRKPLK